LQGEYTGKGRGPGLTIDSKRARLLRGKPLAGKQGAEGDERLEHEAKPHYLLDPEGKAGRTYNARKHSAHVRYQS